MSRRLRPIACLATLAVTLLLSSAGQAHYGHNAGLTGARLEGENYTYPDPTCDPTSDGEHTTVVSAAGDSAGQHAALPAAWCTLHFDAVLFDSVRAFTSTRVAVSGTSSAMTYIMTVKVDGAQVALVQFTQSTADGFQVREFTSSATVAPGVHDVEITYDVASGVPWYVNLFVDYVDTASGCRLVLSDGVCDGLPILRDGLPPVT